MGMYKLDCETFVDRIDALLKERNQGRQELADGIGITTSAISSWKKRNSIPLADTVLSISDFLNVSVRFLLTGKDTNLDPDVVFAASLLQNMPKEKRKLAIELIKTQAHFATLP